MAQVSVQIAHDHIATAFHFFISNLLPLLGLRAGLGPGLSTSIILETIHLVERKDHRFWAFKSHYMSRQYEQQEAVEQGMHLEGNANELARCMLLNAGRERFDRG